MSWINWAGNDKIHDLERKNRELARLLARAEDKYNGLKNVDLIKSLKDKLQDTRLKFDKLNLQIQKDVFEIDNLLQDLEDKLEGWK